jgi:hypothetical protein
MVCVCHQSTRQYSTRPDNRKHQGQGSKAARRPDPYRSKSKGDGSSWNWREVLREDNPVSVVVLKPRQIDGLLDDRVSIWVMRSPTNVGFLHAEGVSRLSV